MPAETLREYDRLERMERKLDDLKDTVSLLAEKVGVLNDRSGRTRELEERVTALERLAYKALGGIIVVGALVEAVVHVAFK